MSIVWFLHKVGYVANEKSEVQKNDFAFCRYFANVRNLPRLSAPSLMYVFLARAAARLLYVQGAVRARFLKHAAIFVRRAALGERP